MPTYEIFYPIHDCKIKSNIDVFIEARVLKLFNFKLYEVDEVKTRITDKIKCGLIYNYTNKVINTVFYFCCYFF
jgi:hypothetical protein